MCLFYTCIQSDYFCYSRIIFSSSLNVLFYFIFFLRPRFFLRHYFLLFLCILLLPFFFSSFFFFFFVPVLFDYFHFVAQSVKVIVSYLVDNAQAHNQKLRNGYYMWMCFSSGFFFLFSAHTRFTCAQQHSPYFHIHIINFAFPNGGRSCCFPNQFDISSFLCNK